jgi:H+/Cl- antiporter ClcA
MLGFLIAAIAGFLTPQIEGPVAGPLVKFLEGQFKVEPNEKRLIAFMVALVVAAILAVLLDSGSTFGVISGAILGYFGQRIFDRLKRIIEARTDGN